MVMDVRRMHGIQEPGLEPVGQVPATRKIRETPETGLQMIWICWVDSRDHLGCPIAFVMPFRSLCGHWGNGVMVLTTGDYGVDLGNEVVDSPLGDLILSG